MLERVMLGQGCYNEAWLQQLIFDYPTLLPVDSIEPGFGELIAVGREVRCSHGYIDNLYVTPAGDIVLAETKLWVNPQARREVVAQALDYVASLMLMDHDVLERSVASSDGWRGGTLYDLVREHPDALDASGFVDAITSNLRRGRMLVLVVGEGIRREAEALAALLQGYAGAQFTFALVELATWRNPRTGDMLCVPDTLAQTVMIERGVVVVENGVALIKPMPDPALTVAKGKPSTLTDEMFFEHIANLSPDLPQAISDFLAQVEPYGVYADMKASLNLRAELGDGAPTINLGYIARNGQLWTNPLEKSVPRELALSYTRRLAALTGGTVASRAGLYLTVDGKSAPQVALLLPVHMHAWVAAIRELLDEVARYYRGVTA
ncbi:hypothetical protein [Sphingomonas prati]|uniref:Uncharacterized protein n=1 Tax=Sphingomonas prati TaxID=1843237 RepID=A0A7W9F2Y9_9SPHN|nr:hypothetical protein [Sphingomonas prati]MBB5730937.1 hypothetical protein [Sphingomonas prati]